MTTKTDSNSELVGLGGQRVALVSVHATGELNGLLLRMKIRQLYRNTTDDNIETVYTFPMAWGTTLLGLKVELNGRTMTGVVLGKADAEEKYEQAIENGDTPVMLEWAGKNLYTANIGNLVPGDEAVIEIEYGQILNVKNGGVRITVPTTLAPRYGEARTLTELAAHHFYGMNPLSEYKFHLNLIIPAPFTQGRISCPSHSIRKTTEGENLLVKLNRKAMLDRDFVLSIEKLDGMAFSVSCADPTEPGKYVALTSFSPDSPNPRLTDRVPLKLKILIDCSGSMAGDSMAQARSALSALVDILTPEDAVSFSKFGAQTANILGELTRCTPDYIDDLKKEVHRLDAVMGGTEMNRAIQRVLAIKDERGELPETASILLITDGEIWNIEEVVATVRVARHRIFAVGVGSAPAESLLQDLALVSGGHCTMVSPKEDMRKSVLELVSRMRSTNFLEVQARYDAHSSWQSPNPFITMAGDMIHHWTKLDSEPSKLAELSWKCHDEKLESQTRHATGLPHMQNTADGILARMFAAQYSLDSTDEEVVMAIALKYQLVTRFTNFFLVFQRPEDDKPKRLPSLQQIEHMQAAGWMGASTVHASESDMEVPAYYRRYAGGDGTNASMAAASVFRTNRSSSNSLSNPRFTSLSQVLRFPGHSDNPFKRLIESINRRSMESDNFKRALRQSLNDDAAALMKAAIDPIVKDGMPESAIWAALLIWLSVEKMFKPRLERFGMRLSRSEIKKITTEQHQALILVFESEAQKPASHISQTGLPSVDALGNIGSDSELADADSYEIPAFLRKQTD